MSRNPQEDHDLITLKEFANRLGRNIEATRRRFGDIAVERRGRLYFKPSDLARLLEAEQRADDHEYTVTRNSLARTLGVDPRTVDKRLAHFPSRLVKGQRRYRERDVGPIVKAARDEELLNEVEVTMLMGGSHIWQLHLLNDFPEVLLRDDAPRVPRTDGRGPMGALWKRKTIGPWAEQLRTNAAKMLKPKGLNLYRIAAAPLEPQNAAMFDIPGLRRHFDQVLAYLEGIRPHDTAYRAAKRRQAADVTTSPSS
jgi:hypothetical protein